MGKLWTYSQWPDLFSPDPDVRDGVCMTMSYYVAKRLLAGLETTPELLNRKIGLFASMQRAKVWDVKLSGIEWVKMLARGDNLKAEFIDYTKDINGAIELAAQAFEDVPESSAAMYLSIPSEGGRRHAVIFFTDKNSQMMIFFDPNLGMYDIARDEDMAEVNRDFGGMVAGGIGAVVLHGTPRDLKFLSSD
jgi:hypothetical protein